MKLNEVIDNVLLHDDSTAMRIAKELHRGSGGDVEKARKMARVLFSSVDRKIAAYDQMSKMQHVNRDI